MARAYRGLRFVSQSDYALKKAIEETKREMTYQCFYPSCNKACTSFILQVSRMKIILKGKAVMTRT